MRIKINGKSYESTKKTKDIIVTTIAGALVAATCMFGFHVMTNIEMYSHTMRYQLHQDVIAGDAEAIEFYESHYLDKGIELW